MPEDEVKGGQGDVGGETPSVDFAAWLKEQSEDVQATYQTHFEAETAGLRSAQGKEREANRAHERAEMLRQRCLEEHESGQNLHLPGALTSQLQPSPTAGAASPPSTRSDAPAAPRPSPRSPGGHPPRHRLA